MPRIAGIEINHPRPALARVFAQLLEMRLEADRNGDHLVMAVKAPIITHSPLLLIPIFRL